MVDRFRLVARWLDHIGLAAEQIGEGNAQFSSSTAQHDDLQAAVYLQMRYRLGAL